MAIQHRRGSYSNFDKSRLVPGEIAVVLSNDPNTSNHTAAYINFSSTITKRIVMAEDIQAELDNAVNSATDRAETAANTAETIATELSGSATQIEENKKHVENLNSFIIASESVISGSIQVGGINTSTGKTNSATNRARLSYTFVESGKLYSLQLNSDSYALSNAWLYTADNENSAIRNITDDIKNGRYVNFTAGQNESYIRVTFKNASDDEAIMTDSDIAAIATAIKLFELTDATLSRKGIPADSKAVGTEINAINEELDDIDQLLYNIDQLLYNIEYDEESEELTFEIGGLSNNGKLSDNASRVRVDMIQTQIVNKTVITCDGSVQFRVAKFSSSNANDFVAFLNDFGTNRVVIDEPCHIRIVARYTATPDAEIVDPTPFDELVYFTEYVPVKVPINYVTDTALNDAIYGEKNIIPKLNQNAYWNIEESTAVYTPFTTGNYYASDPITVSEDEIYEVTARQGSTNKARIWVLTDDNYEIIAMAENHYGTSVNTERFTVPEGATKLLITKQADNSKVVLNKKLTAFDFVNQPLKNLRLSLLGDSISAYAGSIPEGNQAYYTGSNHGVTSVDQMWWKVLCDKTGMTPLIINAWSGSAVTQLEDSSHANKVPMSDDSRCGHLDDGTHNPDIILIAGGVNDYTYAMSAQSEPLTWDAKTSPTLSNSFTEAYACMIKKLQANYPRAIVVALSSWFTMRGTDNGYTLTHTVGNNTYTQQDYNDAIEFVAKQMHIPYMDVSNIGFNRNNFYPNYAEDSASIPTHPNAYGQRVMGCAVAEKLIRLVSGLFA